MSKITKILLVFMLCLLTVLSTACRRAEAAWQGEDKSGASQNNSTMPVEVKEGAEGLSMYAGLEYVISCGEGELLYKYAMGSDALYYIVTRPEKDTYRDHLYRVGYEEIIRLTDENGCVMGRISQPDNDISEAVTEIIPDDESIREWSTESIFAYGDVVYILGYLMRDGKAEYGICRIDSSGSVSGKIDITKTYRELLDEWAIDSLCINGELAVTESEDGEKRYYIGNFSGDKSSFAVIDELGQLVETRDFQFIVNSMSVNEDGSLYFVYADEGSSYAEMAKVVTRYAEGTDGRTMARILSIVGNADILDADRLSCSAEGNMVFGFGNRKGIYIADLSAGEYSMYLKWEDVGVKDVPKWDARLVDDGHVITAYVRRNDSVMSMHIDSFVRSQNDYSGDREQVVIGVHYSSDELEQLVRLFNASSGEYEAVIKEYGYGEEERKRMNTEIISGNGPDLISTRMFDANEYVGSGMIENLYDYLDKSTVVPGDCFIQQVLNAYTVKDCLFAIPRNFSIEAYSGIPEYVGEAGGWTYGELINAVEKCSGCDIGGFSRPGMSAQLYLVEMYWWGNKDKCADWENFKADFDTEEFIEVLSYASEYQVTAPDSRVRETDTFTAGRNLLSDTVICSLGDINKCRNLLGGEVVMKGYPGETGEAVYRIMDNDSYAISAMSGQKQGAWEFIEFILSVKDGDGDSLYFPSRWDYLEKLIENDLKNENIDLHKNPYLAVTREDADILIYMVEHIGFNSTENVTIENIIMEEVQALFAGQNTPETTAKLINDRVQLYLDERR